MIKAYKIMSKQFNEESDIYSTPLKELQYLATSVFALFLSPAGHGLKIHAVLRVFGPDCMYSSVSHVSMFLSSGTSPAVCIGSVGAV